jgi:hypothetical protein
VCVLAVPAAAQPRKKGEAAPPAPAAEPDKPKPDGKDAKDAKDPKKTKPQGPKTFDFSALDLNGRMRTPQLLYFLERANEELERASLEKRSFIPHMIRSLDEEQL